MTWIQTWWGKVTCWMDDAGGVCIRVCDLMGLVLRGDLGWFSAIEMRCS